MIITSTLGQIKALIKPSQKTLGVLHLVPHSLSCHSSTLLWLFASALVLEFLVDDHNLGCCFYFKRAITSPQNIALVNTACTCRQNCSAQRIRVRKPLFKCYCYGNATTCCPNAVSTIFDHVKARDRWSTHTTHTAILPYLKTTLGNECDRPHSLFSLSIIYRKYGLMRGINNANT